MMAETTKIEWTDSTFNPWWGCTKIAPACDNCYAAALDKRTGGNHWGNVDRRQTSDKNWNEPLRWQKRAVEFFAAHGRRRRVFCASMADVFDNQVPHEWRRDLWFLIDSCPDLDWLLLTKRPQNIEKMKPDNWDGIKGRIWLGTTIENQRNAALNVPQLLTFDCAVRFVSCEPLLGELQISNFLRHLPIEGRRRLDWVIAGGESGPQARPMNADWARSLRDQCAAADVAFLFKQWGEHDASQNRVGKKSAGRLLDGRTHDAFPEVA